MSIIFYEREEDMMYRIILLTITFLIIVAITLYAGDWNTSNTNPYINLNGILNPANMRMNHTMSFMTGFSSDGQGFYQSVYTNHLFYKFHPKLDLKVDLNFVNYGTANWEDSFSVKANSDNRSQIIPEFSLHYRPSENTSIRFEFRTMGLHQRNNDWWW